MSIEGNRRHFQMSQSEKQNGAFGMRGDPQLNGRCWSNQYVVREKVREERNTHKNSPDLRAYSTLFLWSCAVIFQHKSIENSAWKWNGYHLEILTKKYYHLGIIELHTWKKYGHFCNKDAISRWGIRFLSGTGNLGGFLSTVGCSSSYLFPIKPPTILN